MNQKVLNLHINQALELFGLFDWWYPQRLVEETGLKAERVKSLTKLRKAFNESAGKNPARLTRKQMDILDVFAHNLSFLESKALEDILPIHVDGDKFKFIDLFAGIGGIRKPFNSIGGKCVLTCEWDDYAQKTYKANWASCEEHQFISDKKILHNQNIKMANLSRARLKPTISTTSCLIMMCYWQASPVNPSPSLVSPRRMHSIEPMALNVRIKDNSFLIYAEY